MCINEWRGMFAYQPAMKMTLTTDERAFAERSFVYTAPRLYNGLPATVKQQASVQNFKIHLKTFLFSRAYNSNTNTINEVYKL